MADQKQLRIVKQGFEVWNNWRKDNPDITGIQIDLSRANLSGANLSGAKLSVANLSGANLSGANLSGAKLVGAKLNGANLSGAKLNGANLIVAKLVGAKLNGANLNGADLCEAKLNEACLDQANLKEADLSGIQALRTNFGSAILTGSYIKDWDINSETNFENVNCEYIYFNPHQQERRPSDSNRNFAPGEFTELVKINFLERRMECHIMTSVVSASDFYSSRSIKMEMMMREKMMREKMMSLHLPLTSVVSASDVLGDVERDNISCNKFIVTDEKFKNKTSSLTGIFLYTEEDVSLVKFIRENYESLDKATGKWFSIYVLEEPCPSLKSLKKYWISLLKSKLYEKWNLYKWITNTKPFDKNESYKIAEKISVSPKHFPCLVLLPPTKELSTEDKLIIPIEEVSTQYFRKLFHILKDIIAHSEEIGKYEAIKINFKTIIQYLEKNSNRVSQQTTTKYQIEGTNIFVNNKPERLIMTQNNPSINISESNVASVTGSGKIDTAITNQHNYASEQKQTLAKAAAEIQKLLNQLEESYPTNTTTEQMVVATEAIKRIENNPSFKQKITNAAREAGLATFEKALDSTAGAFITGAVKGWVEAET